MTDEEFTVEAARVDQTAQGEPADQTVTAPSRAATENGELAWSAEEYAVDAEPDRRHWFAWAALGTVLCLVAGAAVWLATVFYQERWEAPRAVAQHEAQPPVVAPGSPTSGGAEAVTGVGSAGAA